MASETQTGYIRSSRDWTNYKLSTGSITEESTNKKKRKKKRESVVRKKTQTPY